MKHSIIGTEKGDWSVAVICECGERFVGTEDKAYSDHAYHFGLASARAALRGDREDDA